MRAFLLFLFFVFLFVLSTKCNAQLGLFKYSTFYSGISLQNSLNETNTYSIQNGILSETSIDNKFNYRIAYGFRRLARLNFESKVKSYINGGETTWGVFRSSLLSGLEYKLAHEIIRDRGLEYNNVRLWARYLGGFYQFKIESTNLEGVDLKYKQLDLRLKKDIRALQLTLGGCYRFHNAVGVDPFSRDFNTSDSFIDIAEQLGYYSEFYFIDLNNNNHLDRLEQSFYRWYFKGNEIASTTNEFLKYHYSGIVNQYNREQIDSLGIQQTLSIIAGASWYKYNDKYHTLLWANVLPHHKPITEYGYTGGIDYEVGALIQKEFKKNMSFYLEGVYLSYLGRENYNINTGINYIIK